MKHLLYVLDSHASPGNVCWLRLDTIGQEMELSPRTVQRTIAVARALGLIHIRRRNAQTGANAYVLLWSNICEVAGVSLSDPLPSDESTEDTEDGQAILNVHRDANLASQLTLSHPDPEISHAKLASQLGTELSVETTPVSSRIIRIEVLKEEEEVNIKEPPPPETPHDKFASRLDVDRKNGPPLRHERIGSPLPNASPPPATVLQSATNRPRRSPSGDGAVSGEPAEWAELLELLQKFPMVDASTAIAAARDHGLAPREVRALIEFATANRDRWENPAGALWKRLMIGWPGQSPRDGWPEPRAARKGLEAKARSDRQAALSLAADRRETSAAAQRIQRQAETDAALEIRFGSQLDRLETLDRDALAADVLRAGSVQWQRYQRLADSRISEPLIRFALLRELARRSIENLPAKASGGGASPGQLASASRDQTGVMQPP